MFSSRFFQARHWDARFFKQTGSSVVITGHHFDTAAARSLLDAAVSRLFADTSAARGLTSTADARPLTGTAKARPFTDEATL